MSGSYLCHYGRKGMKWHKHIFTSPDEYLRSKENGAVQRNTEATRTLGEEDARAGHYTNEALRLLSSGRPFAAKRSWDKARESAARWLSTGFRNIPDYIVSKGQTAVQTVTSQESRAEESKAKRERLRRRRIRRSEAINEQRRQRSASRTAR